MSRIEVKLVRTIQLERWRKTTTRSTHHQNIGACLSQLRLLDLGCPRSSTAPSHKFPASLLSNTSVAHPSRLRALSSARSRRMAAFQRQGGHVSCPRVAAEAERAGLHLALGVCQHAWQFNGQPIRHPGLPFCNKCSHVLTSGCYMLLLQLHPSSLHPTFESQAVCGKRGKDHRKLLEAFGVRYPRV